ncbi:MAG TPA: hypothetical protein VGM03_11335 [Phycisphaerae bacterium]|jgi:hypothetical protein
MGKESKASVATPPDPNARHVTSEENRAKARKWFAHARDLAEKHNFDYAIKSYIGGLEFWPEAVEEGHKPLRFCAIARRQAGGKKPGMMEKVKFPMTGKDPVKSMLNAEWLLAHDVDELDYMEGVLKNANKARCDDTLMWIGPVYSEKAETEKKPSPKRFDLLKQIYEELGDRAQARGESALAVEAYERGVNALGFQRSLLPNDQHLPIALRDLSTKLTIIKGRYQTSDSFRESIRDADQQAEIHDRDRKVQSSERLEELIARAEKEVVDNPGVTGKLFTLVELLCRRDDLQDEAKAIQLLTAEYQRLGDYKFKLRADDIVLRQFERAARQAKDAADKEAYRAARASLLQKELEIYAERCQKYPTDLRSRLLYAEKLYRSGRLDEAIPQLQQARGDPKNRVRGGLLLGRCFFDKAYYTQASETLQEALGAHESRDDELAKELLYWLARAEESAGQSAGARKFYGQLLQVDYNYRDIRARLDALMKS